MAGDLRAWVQHKPECQFLAARRCKCGEWGADHRPQYGRDTRSDEVKLRVTCESFELVDPVCTCGLDAALAAPVEPARHAPVKRYALIEHHHQGGHYGEEHWRTSSMDERHDGDFVKWADYEAAINQPVEPVSGLPQQEIEQLRAQLVAQAAVVRDQRQDIGRLRRTIASWPKREYLETDHPDVIACMGSAPACAESGCQYERVTAAKPARAPEPEKPTNEAARAAVEYLCDLVADLENVTWLAPVSAAEMNKRDRWLAGELETIASDVKAALPVSSAPSREHE